MIDKIDMANRRLSWMDQIGSSGAQRRSSRIDPYTLQETPNENMSSSPALSSSPPPRSSTWTPTGPSSNLRATAAIWTPQLSSSELEEHAVEDDYFEDFESKLTVTSSEDKRVSPPVLAISPNPNSNVGPFVWPVKDVEEIKGISHRKSSNISDSAADLPASLRRGAGTFPQYPSKKMELTNDPNSLPLEISSGDGLALKLTTSAPSTLAQRAKGISEIPPTPSDLHMEEIQGALATDDSVYAVVEFKLFRAEVYQLRRDWIGGDEGLCLVIVEADRGIDLGKVSHIGTDPDVAREVKRNLNRKHWSALLQNSATSKPSDEESEIAFRQVYEWTANSPFAGGFTAGDGTMPPRSIVRRATRMEINKLQAKEGFEEKARRLCWQKAKEHGFTMEILGAEFQFDHQKLTFYFLAPGYVAFNPLINELYKLFKTRIWFVPLNPASFVNPSAAGHSHSAGGGSGHEGLWNSQQSAPGMMGAKNMRRDSRHHPGHHGPMSPAAVPRPPGTNPAGYMSPSTGSGPQNPWGTMPKRMGDSGSWASPSGAQGFSQPSVPGQRLWK